MRCTTFSSAVATFPLKSSATASSSHPTTPSVTALSRNKPSSEEHTELLVCIVKQMDGRDLFLVQCFLILSLCVVASGKCYDTGFFRLNSTYDTNRNLILSSLSSNIMKEGGFYNTSLGQDPNRIYASALCGNGYNSEACSRCVDSVSQKLMQTCPNQTEAYSWDGINNASCMVRYSNVSYFGSLQLSPSEALYNTGDIQSDLTQFDEVWQALMLRVLNRASAGNSSSRIKYYAVEIQALTPFQDIYAFMQCAPDISPAECKSCLRESVGDYQSCCYGKQGGPVSRPSCFFRWDLYPFYGAFENLASAPPPSPSEPKSTTKEGSSGSISSGTIVAIVVPVVIILVLILIVFVVCRRKKSYKMMEDASSETEAPQSLRFDLATIRAATTDFSIENKLGQGGFGSVFKGKLASGQEIAVKRLSVDSGQGEAEFKNEVVLLAELQHRNLVKLLGFCWEGKERLLVYEFVPNSSLDHLIFEPSKRSLLTWDIRYKIIGGIARGILYLHEDSRLRIIHRDLKASNFLLDHEMNPKISDFGMARLFAADETQGETSRIMGTYGYMSPEYLRQGQFSVKSDVYSFGVLLLEIITGQKNTSFAEGLPAYAWKHWDEGRGQDIVDPIVRNGSRSEIMRCIHIGLLCVQMNVASRPTMNSVVLWLSSGSTSLPVPATPAFAAYSSSDTGASSFQQHKSGRSDQSQEKATPFSLNDASITTLEPR